MREQFSSDPINTEGQRVLGLIRNSGNSTNPQLSDVARSLTQAAGGNGDYGGALRQNLQDRFQREDREISQGNNAMTMLKAMKEQGHADADAVDKAITRFAGNDPQRYQSLLQALHEDPEPVTRLNAVTKAAIAASRLNISNPDPMNVPYGSRVVDKNTGKIITDIDLGAFAAKGGARGTEFERLSQKIQDGTATPQETQRLQTIARGGKDTFTAETQKNSAKEVNKLREQAGQADTLLGAIDATRKSLDGMTTGPIVGYAQAFTPQGQFANSSISKLVLDSAALLKGSVSNYEDQIVQKTKPMLTNYPNANENILSVMNAQARRARARTNFMEEWANRSGGNLQGSERAWQKFTEENHIIGDLDKKTGVIPINENNIDNWQSYLNGGGGAPQDGASADVDQEKINEFAKRAQEKGYSRDEIIRYLGGSRE